VGSVGTFSILDPSGQHATLVVFVPGAQHDVIFWLGMDSEEMQSSEPLSLLVPFDASFADKKVTNEMIRDVRTHYDEMGKALMCPICQSTLKRAI